jgi:hypothetical protein
MLGPMTVTAAGTTSFGMEAVKNAWMLMKTGAQLVRDIPGSMENVSRRVLKWTVEMVTVTVGNATATPHIREATVRTWKHVNVLISGTISCTMLTAWTNQAVLHVMEMLHGVLLPILAALQTNPMDGHIVMHF